MKKYFLLPVAVFVIIVLAFFYQFFAKGLLPIPSDTIIGLYHPFRDLYAQNYPNGIPFKNFLITDPVRQQYPWRSLVIDAEKNFTLPLWNPYSFAGAPLLANFQSSSFYPFNIFLYRLPLGWSFLILLQPMLAGIFLYFYLRNLKILELPALLGAFVFAFCGFSVAWMEWNTVVQTALWLPLILLSVDKVFARGKLRTYNVGLIIWSFIFVLSLVFSFFAGHLQTFFYLFIISFVYILARWFQNGKKTRTLVLYIILTTLFIILTVVQWLPTLQFILLSNRTLDQSWQQAGWFIPWQHLVQFVAPDFFGNPTTLNYWGVWNYAEFVGYIGIAPLLAALFALFFRRDKKTFFFGTFFFLSLIFALPTGISSLPFILKIPFLSTAQPTRLLFITDFCLSILAALGLDYFIKVNAKRNIIYILAAVLIIFIGLWGFIFLGKHMVLPENLQTAKQNLYFPTLLFFVSATLFVLLWKVKQKTAGQVLLFILIGLTVVDLFRFGWKFLPFTPSQYLFPKTQAISFLQKQPGQFRIMTTDSRILAPNFSDVYKLQSIEGYDPLYTTRYAQLISASERKRPDISGPFGFNRIITPHNYDSKIIDLLGVRYILSLSDLQSLKLTKVFQEGQTQVYENKDALPRAFFVKNIHPVASDQEAIQLLFDKNFAVADDAVVQNFNKTAQFFGQGNVHILSYSPNKIVVRTANDSKGFLVFADTYYPTWKATVDGTATEIYMTDFDFRGIIVPAGVHTIIFSDSLF